MDNNCNETKTTYGIMEVNSDGDFEPHRRGTPYVKLIPIEDGESDWESVNDSNANECHEDIESHEETERFSSGISPGRVQEQPLERAFPPRPKTRKPKQIFPNPESDGADFDESKAEISSSCRDLASATAKDENDSYESIIPVPRMRRITRKNSTPNCENFAGMGEKSRSKSEISSHSIVTRFHNNNSEMGCSLESCQPSSILNSYVNNPRPRPPTPAPRIRTNAFRESPRDERFPILSGETSPSSSLNQLQVQSEPVLRTNYSNWEFIESLAMVESPVNYSASLNSLSTGYKSDDEFWLHEDYPENLPVTTSARSSLMDFSFRRERARRMLDRGTSMSSTFLSQSQPKLAVSNIPWYEEDYDDYISLIECQRRVIELRSQTIKHLQNQLKKQDQHCEQLKKIVTTKFDLLNDTLSSYRTRCPKCDIRLRLPPIVTSILNGSKVPMVEVEEDSEPEQVDFKLMDSSKVNAFPGNTHYPVNPRTISWIKEQQFDENNNGPDLHEIDMQINPPSKKYLELYWNHVRQEELKDQEMKLKVELLNNLNPKPRDSLAKMEPNAASSDE